MRDAATIPELYRFNRWATTRIAHIFHDEVESDVS